MPSTHTRIHFHSSSSSGRSTDIRIDQRSNGSSNLYVRYYRRTSSKPVVEPKSAAKVASEKPPIPKAVGPPVQVKAIEAPPPPPKAASVKATSVKAASVKPGTVKAVSAKGSKKAASVKA